MTNRGDETSGRFMRSNSCVSTTQFTFTTRLGEVGVVAHVHALLVLPRTLIAIVARALLSDHEQRAFNASETTTDSPARDLHHHQSHLQHKHKRTRKRCGRRETEHLVVRGRLGHRPEQGQECDARPDRLRDRVGAGQQLEGGARRSLAASLSLLKVVQEESNR